ncbi:histidine kinase [Bradyrhizobium sp. CCBAU 53340]|uniref:GAF domain-containing protein n=1 Tax=Bradyrhizobium sp. CCBAU 53340 TaxID=1325112 RepID=UPI00188BE29D|nr:GAF domain-containing protein [Bradyrhizobium sp. CCBAU 53340]QOZ45532.1 histidine kinase [Bradyrhizobium sp. CCBAU 53340]
MRQRGDKVGPGKGRRQQRTKAGKLPVSVLANDALNHRLRQRTRELDEALQQQAATSEVLSIIRKSPVDAQPVFEAIVESAARLCGAIFSVVYLQDNDRLRFAATKNFSTTAINQIRERQDLRQINRSFVGGRAILDLAIVQIPDVLADPEYSREFALAGGWRAVLAVPLLHEGKSVGAITVGKTEPTAFSEQQIRLLQTFADQAVIAIQNARLFDEVQARTRDLETSLQQQTATADVLKVISRSTFDLQPVLDTLLSSACRLCEADIGTVRYQDGSTYRLAADYGCIPEWRDHLARQSSKPDRGTIFGRTIVEGRTVHIPDVLVDPEFTRLAAQKLMGFRAALGVPLIREGRVFGVLSLLGRSSFTAKQIELVETFADQAVIAIENARLFNETQEALERQTATAEVLQVISSSPGELGPVFEAMLENAVRICRASFGTLLLYEGDRLRRVARMAAQNVPQLYAPDQETPPHFIAPFDGVPSLRRLVETKALVHIADIATEHPDDLIYKVAAARTVLIVPMLKESELVGGFAVYRKEVQKFSDKQVELLENFAAQAVIAIENTRLLKELRQRTDDLSKSLDDLRTAQDRLVQTEKLASLGQLTAGIAHEIKNPLNFVNNFATLSAELTEELNEALKPAELVDKIRTEVDELTTLLKSNLEKVVQHGKRADSIVKNMLLHSREGPGERRLADINALVQESLNLAYHGGRAEKSDFNITLTQDFDPDAGEIEVYPQEITRALLNVISNGFYAATRRKSEAGDETFEPVLSATTNNLDDKVEIRIRDNGTGIPVEVKEKMFNPFFTTKPAGEGTGLGLSMTHDIIVKQHGGTLDVESELGVFTEFIITLPR